MNAGGDQSTSVHTAATLSDDAEGAAWALSQEEEAAILAEYGVAGVYDEVWHVPAVSHFHAELDGGRDVFLTGGKADDAGGEDDPDPHGGQPAVSPTADELLYDPLDALLLKYNDVAFRHGAPESFMDGVQAAMASSHAGTLRRSEDNEDTAAADNARFADPLSSNPYAAFLAESRSMERLVFSKVQRTHGGKLLVSDTTQVHSEPAPVEHDGDSDPLLREADGLLQRATDCLKAPAVRKPVEENTGSADGGMQAKLENVCTTLGPLDLMIAESDSDDDGTAVLHRARALILAYASGDARFHEDDGPHVSAALSLADAAPEAPAVNGERRQNDSPDSTSTPALFDCEFSPPRTDEGVAEGWEQLAIDMGKRLHAVTARLGQPVKENSEADNADTSAGVQAGHQLVYDAAALEAADDALAAKAAAQYARSLQQLQETIAESDMRREARGWLVLDSFSARLETLVPPSSAAVLVNGSADESDTQVPSHREAAERGRAMAVNGPAVTVADSDGSLAPSRQTVDKIQRHSRAELWRLEWEAQERKMLRQEDDRMSRYVEEKLAALEHICEKLQDLPVECDSAARALYIEENKAFGELLAAHERSAQLVARAIELRQVRATKAICDNLTEAHKHGSEDIENEEQIARQQLREHASAAYSACEQKEADRLETEKKSIVAAEVTQRQRFVETGESHRRSRETSCSKLLSLLAEVRYRTFHSVAMLSPANAHFVDLCNEARTLSAWVQSHRQALQETEKALEEEILQCAQELKQPSRVPVASTAPEVPLRSSEASDEKVLDRVLLEQHAPAATDPAETGLFHLQESVQSLSFALEAIHDIDYDSVRRLYTHKGNDVITVSDLVESLDLGSNSLKRLSLPALLWCFPNLRKLGLSDNGLMELSRSTSEFPFLQMKSRRPGSSMAFRGAAAAQQNARAEKCLLHDVNISSNVISDLSALGELLPHSLQSLSAFANRIDSLLTLQRCQRLWRLELNRNAVTNLDDLGTLRLLSHLNLCDNKLSIVATNFEVSNPLLSRLFLSGNTKLCALPRGEVCFLFLSQLFLNHCGFTELSEANFPRMPLLSVLHVEDNAVTDVSGLRGCPRLCELNVAFNALQQPTALHPIMSCKWLEKLDVRGNPLVESDKHQVCSLLRANLPCLVELCGADVRLNAPHPLQNGRQSWRSAGSFSFPWVISAVACDYLLTDLRSCTEITRLFGAARLRSVEGLEEQTRQRRIRDGKEHVSSSNALSSTVAARNRLSELEATRRSLQAIAAIAVGSESHGEPHPEVLCNRPCVNTHYAERRTAFRERLAQATIARFLHGRLQIRVARAELLRLRQQGAESDDYRREMAARTIQPVWRGAALRSRLARILHKNDGVGDDEEFQKVDIDFDDSDLSAAQSARLADVLRQTVNDQHDMDAPPLVRGFHRFNVPATVVNGPVTSTLEPHNVQAEVGLFQGTLRAGSAPHTTERPQTLSFNDNGSEVSVGPSGEKKSSLATPRRPHSDLGAPKAPRRTPHPPGSSGLVNGSASVPAGSVEEAWGATVATQIQKKNKKLRRVHQEFLRSEYVRDPLNAKRQGK